MLVSIGSFYVNLDKVETFGVFETMADYYEAGLIINGTKYTIYTVSGPTSEELRKDLRKYVQQILEDVIKQTKQEVVKIDLPQPDISKYIDGIRAQQEAQRKQQEAQQEAQKKQTKKTKEVIND